MMKGFDDRESKLRSLRKVGEMDYRIRRKEARVRLHREIKRYVSRLCNGTSRETGHPDNPTLLVWMRECRRVAMFEEGKILFEKSCLSLEILDERQRVEVIEDYMVCTRILGRSKPQDLINDIGPDQNTGSNNTGVPNQ